MVYPSSIGVDITTDEFLTPMTTPNKHIDNFIMLNQQLNYDKFPYMQ